MKKILFALMTFGALTANAQGFIDLQARLAS